MPTRGMTTDEALAEIERLASLVRDVLKKKKGPMPMQVPPTSSWSLVVDGKTIALSLFSLGSSTQGMPQFTPGWQKDKEHWFLTKNVDLNAELGSASKVELKLDVSCGTDAPCPAMIAEANAVLSAGSTFQMYALTKLSDSDWVAGGPPSLGAGFSSYYFVASGGGTAPRLLFDVPSQDGSVLARLSWITKTRYSTIAGGFTALAQSIPSSWPSTWWHYSSTPPKAARRSNAKRKK